MIAVLCEACGGIIIPHFVLTPAVPDVLRDSALRHVDEAGHAPLTMVFVCAHCGGMFRTGPHVHPDADDGAARLGPWLVVHRACGLRPAADGGAS